MKKIIIFVFVLFMATPAFAGNNWFVHDGAAHYEGRYSQANAQAIATAKGWTAVKGIANIPGTVKTARRAKETQAVQDKVNRISEIKSKLTSVTPAQLNNYIDANVTDPGTAKVLKRILRLLQYQALETGK